jgi:hypothetical protein
MGVIANHGRFSRGVAISSFAEDLISYETFHKCAVGFLIRILQSGHLPKEN